MNETQALQAENEKLKMALGKILSKHCYNPDRRVVARLGCLFGLQTWKRKFQDFCHCEACMEGHKLIGGVP